MVSNAPKTQTIPHQLGGPNDCSDVNELRFKIARTKPTPRTLTKTWWP